jgi:hypothetical protein
MTDIIAEAWERLQNEEQREECLEALYESIANASASHHNLALLSNEGRAQFELDVDMLLITIAWEDIGTVIFDRGVNEAYFWSRVGDKNDKKNKKIYRSLFS